MTREELRDYVDEQRILDNIPYHVYSALIDGIDTLEEEPKTGHWKFTTHYARRYRICPFCNVEREDDRSTRWNFCPNCGADLRGDDNEVDN